MLGELLHIGSQTAAVPVPAGEAYMGVGAALTAAGDRDVPPTDDRGFSGHFNDHVLLLLFL